MRSRFTSPGMVAGLLVFLTAQSSPSADVREVSALIDHHIQARLDSEDLKRASAADDAEFLRRAFLDLHGVVPTAERAERFLDNAAAGQREELIDELLASPRFGEHLGDLWRKNLISPLASEQRTQTERFSGWLAARFNGNQGWDRIVDDLLTARGTIDENPAVVYLIEGRYPLGVTDLTDLTSRYFLGVRLNCAQCHDHPFVDWQQQDYWGMAAFFAQIQTPGRPKQVYRSGIQDDTSLTMASLEHGDTIDGFLLRPPKFLGGDAPATGSEPDRRVLARWITSPENPYFARAAVNRTWWHLFGRGLVNPVDDMHGGNPPSHPELLDGLSRAFAASRFDLKFLYRAILNSRTYQQTSRAGEQPEREAELFARMSIKVLSPEQLYDSLLQILGPPAKAPAIDTHGDARREFSQFFAESGDPEPARYQQGIPQLLRLMNSPQFAGRNLSALVKRTTERGGLSEDVVEHFFLAILARRPTATEQETALDHLRRNSESREAACRELAWALLMSSEFSLNH